MTDLMRYKGYLGSVRYNDADRVFHGRLEFLRDLVTFEAQDRESLRPAFEEAVEDYLELCAEHGRVPERSSRAAVTPLLDPTPG